MTTKHDQIVLRTIKLNNELAKLDARRGRQLTASEFDAYEKMKAERDSLREEAIAILSGRSSYALK